VPDKYGENIFGADDELFGVRLWRKVLDVF
jgi:hypothetical protein